MNETGMGVTPEYEALALALSAFAILLSLIYLQRVVIAYQTWHDERAAVSLGKAVGLTVIAFGFLVSSIGLPIENPTLAIAGLSISRGALVVLVSTLLLANVRPGHRDSVGDVRPADSMTRSDDLEKTS
jgi:uncharacterized membrane protein (DUF485 family)